MADLVPVRRALLSVSNKTGLEEFARALHQEFGIELLSTGGTARFLRDRGLPVTDVSEITGFPEMMDGRVKTLHPMIHGGLLALRDNPEHAAAMSEHGIKPIDLVCVNLYPFAQTIAKPGVTFAEAIENIDIGGPSMIRSAAKNHRFVLVVTSPDRYEKVLGDLRKHGGASCGEHRLKQAQRAFLNTSEYDARISQYLAEEVLRDVEKSADLPAHREAMFSAAPIDSQARLHKFLMAQALIVKATEAAAFAVENPTSDQLQLRMVEHIRPDDSPASVRESAVRAFADIVKPCITNVKDGAIEIGSSRNEKFVNPQFCLVTLLWTDGAIAGVTAVITRCEDSTAAHERLTILQLVASHWGSGTRVGSAGLPPANPQAETGALPATIAIFLQKKQELRYGENPHQKAALYVSNSPAEASVAFAKQLHGKELSYINLLDADAALSAVKELAGPAACIVKHATPCGFATATDLPMAFRNAFAGDPLAAFGGIVALNQRVDLATAKEITSINKLLEVIVAPSYDDDALDLLRQRWKNLRLLEVGPVAKIKPADQSELHLHRIVGGYLVQERDLIGVDESTWQVVTTRLPTVREMADLKIAWLACKHVKSNAVVVATDGMMLGSGAGQQDRVNACRIAIQKAGDRVKGAVAASDAFFPFPDGPQLLLDAGITALIHPGGSVKDQETIDAANRAGAAIVITGQRHFKH